MSSLRTNRHDIISLGPAILPILLLASTTTQNEKKPYERNYVNAGTSPPPRARRGVGRPAEPPDPKDKSPEIGLGLDGVRQATPVTHHPARYTPGPSQITPTTTPQRNPTKHCITKINYLQKFPTTDRPATRIRRKPPRPSDIPEINNKIKHKPLRLRGGADLNEPPHQSTHTADEIPRQLKDDTHGSITIASLNVKGANSPTTRGKWGRITHQMKTKKISLICLLETHSNDTQIESLNKKFNPQFQIYHTHEPDHSRAGGIAIIKNNNIITNDLTDTTEIIPGRAITTTITWPQETKINILAVYAPNQPRENKEFWDKLNQYYNLNNARCPDIILGDFNIVEDATDRLPPHPDPPLAESALRNLIVNLELTDGWRHANPQPECGFTYQQQSNGSMSRIDRIYAKQYILNRSLDWQIIDADIPTDHRMISCKIHDQKAPAIGKGRWAIPTYLTKDDNFIKEIETLGNEILNNRQSLQEDLQRFVEETLNKARKADKIKSGKINSTINKLEKAKRKILNKISNSDDPDRIMNKQEAIKAITDKINDIKNTKHIRTQEISKANWRLYGEMVNKYWCRSGKDKKGRDTIAELRDISQTHPTYTTNSQEMANIMAKHYTDVQSVDINVPQEPRNNEINNLLRDMPHINEAEITEMAEEFNRAEIIEALQKSPNDKSPGPNGIPTEMYKILHKRHVKLSKENKPSFDVINLLLEAYNDILVHGHSDERLLEGWICPSYKKKDKREAVNYRPITVLNAEYKILTSAITNRLSTVAPKLIHKSQAAFVKERSIFDQIDLAQRMILLSELSNQKGALILLDQEKAYDRIRHDYLWRTLETAKIPRNIINTIKALYTNAKTTVILNGTISNPFPVNRGVRQGDPLSCLLFNLAIEPLSRLICETNDINGLKIKTPTAELIAKLALFADDAAVYTAQLRNISILFNILEKWCIASGAKFNKEKTNIIPLGPTEYRQNVIHTRSFTNDPTQKIEETIRIVKDGESVRYLGAQIGNNIKNNEPWPQILTSIEKSLNIWEKSYPGLEGRRHIVQMIIGGKTQFTTAAQGMPEEYTKQLTKITRSFLWGSETTPPIALKQLSDPITQGGRKILDLKARNDAINIIKLKKILDYSDNRPLAADAAIDIINRSLPNCITEKLQHIAPTPNIFLLSTLYKKQHAFKTIPKPIRDTINTGLKYNLTFDAPIIAEQHKRELPAWFHISELDQKIKHRNDKYSKCLMRSHNVRTINELAAQGALSKTPTHIEAKGPCNCQDCPKFRTQGCENPIKCYKKAARIIKNLPQKYNPETPSPLQNAAPTPDEATICQNHALINPSNIKIFDANITTTGNLFENFRILSSYPRKTYPQATRDPPINNPTDQIVYTDGSCTKNGDTDAKAGLGVWFSPNDPRNTAAPVGKNITQSNNVAELLAVHKALTLTPSTNRLHIKTDSKWVIRTLCDNAKKLTDDNFVDTHHANLIKPILSKLRRRAGSTSFEWIKGHSGIEGNEKADTLAAEGASMSNNKNVIFIANPEFSYQGAKLATISQSTAYKLIIAQKNEKIRNRERTKANLDMIREITHELNDAKPTNERIWTTINKNRRDLSVNVRTFLWKLIHDAHKCGTFWTRIPNYEERGICQNCNTIETMSHILFECQENQNTLIWNIAKTICEKKDIQWPATFNIAAIMATPLLKIKDNNGETRQGATRLFQIVVTESAFLIWKLRCKRILDPDYQNGLTSQEAKNQIMATLNSRLSQDRILTSRKRYGNKAIPEQIVLKTWSGTLHDEASLPRKWLTANGVLVGSTDNLPPPAPEHVIGSRLGVG